MLNRILKNKKNVLIIIALFLIAVIAIVLLKGCSNEKGSGVGINMEQDGSQTKEEPYDGDGLDVIGQDNDEKEDSTSVDDSWEEESNKQSSGDSPNNSNQNNADSSDDNGNNNTGDEEDTDDKKDETDQSDEDIATDEKSWGTIF